MAQEFWLSLPVKNIKRSEEFFTAIGLSFSDLDGHKWNVQYTKK
jgi:predicted lactoylglutathione lyase